MADFGDEAGEKIEQLIKDFSMIGATGAGKLVGKSIGLGWKGVSYVLHKKERDAIKELEEQINKEKLFDKAAQQFYGDFANFQPKESSNKNNEELFNNIKNNNFSDLQNLQPERSYPQSGKSLGMEELDRNYVVISASTKENAALMQNAFSEKGLGKEVTTMDDKIMMSPQVFNDLKNKPGFAEDIGKNMKSVLDNPEKYKDVMKKQFDAQGKRKLKYANNKSARVTNTEKLQKNLEKTSEKINSKAKSAPNISKSKTKSPTR